MTEENRTERRKILGTGGRTGARPEYDRPMGTIKIARARSGNGATAGSSFARRVAFWTDPGRCGCGDLWGPVIFQGSVLLI